VRNPQNEKKVVKTCIYRSRMSGGGGRNTQHESLTTEGSAWSDHLRPKPNLSISAGAVEMVMSLDLTIETLWVLAYVAHLRDEKHNQR